MKIRVIVSINVMRLTRRRKLLLCAGMVAVSPQIVPRLLPESQMKYDLIAITRSVTNIGRVTGTICLSAMDYHRRVKPFEEDKAEFHKRLRNFHIRTAHRIYWLCISSKGIYIKFGQYLSTLERVMPKEIIEILRGLQDEVPPHGIPAISVVLKRDLGEKINEIVSIEPVPIGSASIAQVHKATLRDGREVAVKTQYPELRYQLPIDIYLLSQVTRFFSMIFRSALKNSYDYNAIITKFKSSVQEEVNFEKEAANANRARKLFENNSQVFIPKMFKDLCSKRVIVMDFASGVKIDKKEKMIEAGIDPKEVGSILCYMFARMIFTDGFIHCDPHPGNLLVRKDESSGQTQIVLLDHGFYRELTPKFRATFIDLWLALVGFDHKRVKSVAEELGIKEYYRYLPLVFLFKSKGVDTLGGNFGQEEIRRLKHNDDLEFKHIFNLINTFPEDLLFIIRTSNLIGQRNVVLGGSHRQRLMIMTWTAMKERSANSVVLLWRYSFFRLKLFVFEWMRWLYTRIYFIDHSFV